MFFFFAITTRQKELESRWIQCPSCQKKEYAHVFMTYSVLILFFIPIFTWNKQYYVRMDSCQNLYQSNAEFTELHLIQKGSRTTICPFCLETLDADYAYCPHCGNKLES